MQTDRVRKSVNVDAEILEKFKDWINSQPTKLDAAIKMGMNRNSLDRITTKGSCYEKTLEKIREILSV